MAMNMRILYLANIRLPTEKAHGLQIMENCSAFVKSAGLDVSLLIPRRFNKIKADPFHYYALDPIFKVCRLWCLDLLILPIFKHFWFVLETITFTFSAWLYTIRHRKEIDFLYTREAGIAVYLSTIRPLFYEVHSLPKKNNWLYRRAFEKARGIIVISQGLQNDLIAWGVTKEKILAARDGVNMEKFDIKISKEKARERLNLPTDRLAVIYSGHLYSWKGADLLAEAGRLLPNSIHIYFIGGTDQDVARFRAQYKIDNIHVIGHRSQDEIPVWLKAADVLVIPNSARERISSHYTSPLKLFEYMAAARPIIASDLPSIREVVSDDEVTFFRPDNKGDLAQKIMETINHQASLQKRVLLLQEKVWQYSWESRGKNIIDMILTKK